MQEMIQRAIGVSNFMDSYNNALICETGGVINKQLRLGTPYAKDDLDFFKKYGLTKNFAQRDDHGSSVAIELLNSLKFANSNEE